MPHAGGAGAGYVLGVDNCPPMIEAARELQSGRDEYLLADAQDLSFLAEASFDLVVSYLNQCDLPDFDANVREVFRVLKAGGALWWPTSIPCVPPGKLAKGT